MIRLLATPCLVAAAIGALPVAASEPGASAAVRPARAAFDPAIVIVRADGLDLATVDGRARLDARIARAAAQVCDPEPEARSLRLDEARRSCIEATIAASQPARARAISEHRARGQATAALRAD